MKVKYEVVLDRDDQDLGQWRIKIVVEEMNLHCSSSYLLIKEDSEKTRRVKYCNEEDTGSKVFFSHEHLISIVFKNKVRDYKCNPHSKCSPHHPGTVQGGWRV